MFTKALKVAVLTLLFAFFLRKWGWIKDGDLKLQ